MNVEEQIKYWVATAEHDMPAAEHLFTNGQYVWCLYIGHLILEKILKAVYVRDNKTTPPKIYDLVKLAKATKLELTKEQMEFLNIATDFNLETRYPDVKMALYKTYDKKFTEENFPRLKGLYQWIKSQLKY